MTHDAIFPELSLLLAYFFSFCFSLKMGVVERKVVGVDTVHRERNAGNGMGWDRIVFVCRFLFLVFLFFCFSFVFICAFVDPPPFYMLSL